MTYGLSNGHVTDDVTWPWKVAWRHQGHVTFQGDLQTPWKLVTPISRNILRLDTSNLVCCFVWAMPCRRTNNFPWKWAWPRSRDPYNRSTVGYPSDSLASCFHTPLLFMVKILGCSLWSRSVMLGSAERRELRLISHEIIFEVFRPMWSRYLNVTVTDGSTDIRTTCRSNTALYV